MLEKFNKFKTWFTDSETSNTDRVASGVIILMLAILSWIFALASIWLAINVTPLFMFYVAMIALVWALMQLRLL